MLFYSLQVSDLLVVDIHFILAANAVLRYPICPPHTDMKCWYIAHR